MDAIKPMLEAIKEGITESPVSSRYWDALFIRRLVIFYKVKIERGD